MTGERILLIFESAEVCKTDALQPLKQLISIARKLGLRCVEQRSITHLDRMFRKLGVHTRTGVVVCAFETFHQDAATGNQEDRAETAAAIGGEALVNRASSETNFDSLYSLCLDDKHRCAAPAHFHLPEETRSV